MASDSTVHDRIASFRGDFRRFDDAVMVQKHITFGTSYILRAEQYFELKRRISDNFGLHPSHVIVVGSGKLGFSIAPGKRYRPFGEESDLDVAIVSGELFRDLWLTALGAALLRRRSRERADGFCNQHGKSYLTRRRGGDEGGGGGSVTGGTIPSA